MKRLVALLAALTLIWAAAAFAEEAEGQTFDWGGLGRVRLTEVRDYSDDMNLTVDGSPDGKWVVAVFTILDGAEMDASKAFEYAKTSVEMNDFPMTNLAGRGMRIDPKAAKAVLTGDIVVFFDAPADFDPSGAAVKVNGAEAVIPAAGETAE